MKFLCGSCRTKYQISDEKVHSKILTIRCKKCGAKVLVKESLAKQGGIAIAPLAEVARAASQVLVAREAAGGHKVQQPRVAQGGSLASAFEVAMSAAPDDMPTSIVPTPSDGDGVEWFVAIDGVQRGPFAYSEVVKKLQNREVQSRHYVWHDGFDGWKRIRETPEFIPFVPADKKRPPPVPASASTPEGGKVVDFAKKRAERQGQAHDFSGAPASAIGDDEPTAAVGTHPTGTKARDEELDQVINRALGIQGEGQTTRAAADAASGPRVGGSAAKVSTGELDLGAALAQGGGIPEDLFDMVPRASAQDLVARESTRFFVQAAGVNKQKSRNRAGKQMGAALAVLVAGFLGLWAMGIVQIKLPSLGSLIGPKGVPDDVPIDDYELTDAERKELLAALKGQSREAKRGVAEQFLRGKKRKQGGASVGRPLAYVEERPSESTTPGGVRQDEGPEAFRIEVGTHGSAVKGGVGEVALPMGDLRNMVPVETGKLDEGAIRAVVTQGTAGVKHCVTQAIRGGQDLGQKLEVHVTILSTGDVSRATSATSAYKSTKLAACIEEKIKAWRFPTFEGSPQEIKIPFHLQKSSSF